jgi:hypothetical protein
MTRRETGQDDEMTEIERRKFNGQGRELGFIRQQHDTQLTKSRLKSHSFSTTPQSKELSIRVLSAPLRLHAIISYNSMLLQHG